jgi:hypothetical protein
LIPLPSMLYGNDKENEPPTVGVKGKENKPLA